MLLYCHRTVLKKVWSNRSTPTTFMQRCFSSSTQSLLSPLMYVPPRVGVDESKSLADHNDSFHFFNPADQTKIRVTKKQYIPGQKHILTPDDAICVGSSHGWLAFVNPSSCSTYLLNPLIQSSHLPYVPLPPFETIPYVRGIRSNKSDLLSPSPSLVKDFLSVDMEMGNGFLDEESKRFVPKVAMSSAPSLPRSSSPDDDEDCTVMILDGYDPYFCKLGSERWHMLDESGECKYFYNDIMYFSKDRRFYTMSLPRCIDAWDLSDPACPKRERINPACPVDLAITLSQSGFFRYLCYLVESSGNLLLVVRLCFLDETPDKDNNSNYTKEGEDSFNGGYKESVFQSYRFYVYKLNFDQNRWERVECLGDRVLFVGRNHSFSLSISDYPELKENSIYFTINYQDYFNAHGNDSGIFHLKDGSITTYYPVNLKCRQLPHPVWIAPNKL